MYIHQINILCTHLFGMRCKPFPEIKSPEENIKQDSNFMIVFLFQYLRTQIIFNWNRFSCVRGLAASCFGVCFFLRAFHKMYYFVLLSFVLILNYINCTYL